MRKISTTEETVDTLKKQAKKLQRKNGGKHVDLLDRVAKSHGYLHWHHVLLCLQEGKKLRGLEVLNRELALITEAAQAGLTKVFVTGPEALHTMALVFFASEGDAWLLNPVDRLAACLVWRGNVQAPPFTDEGDDVAVQFIGDYRFEGAMFVVDTEHSDIGARAIAGYPVDELRDIIDQRLPEMKLGSLFLQEDALDLTPELMTLMTKLEEEGWARDALENSRKMGARYSPSRDTFVTPPVSGEF